jgi:hypothetical protein
MLELATLLAYNVGARCQRVFKVVLMSDFPRSVAGKTLQRELREPCWAATGRMI